MRGRQGMVRRSGNELLTSTQATRTNHEHPFSQRLGFSAIKTYSFLITCSMPCQECGAGEGEGRRGVYTGVVGVMRMMGPDTRGMGMGIGYTPIMSPVQENVRKQIMHIEDASTFFALTLNHLYHPCPQSITSVHPRQKNGRDAPFLILCG